MIIGYKCLAHSHSLSRTMSLPTERQRLPGRWRMTSLERNSTVNSKSLTWEAPHLKCVSTLSLRLKKFSQLPIGHLFLSSSLCQASVFSTWRKTLNVSNKATWISFHAQLVASLSPALLLRCSASNQTISLRKEPNSLPQLSRPIHLLNSWT